MKKLLLLTATVLNVLLLDAQGIYQLWGMTPGGGSDNLGTIFKMDGLANNFQVKYDFKTLQPGSQPQNTQLIEYNNKFYGMTQTGGTNNSGIIFEWDPATNISLKKIDFTGLNGMYPYGSLTLHDGRFYGMTQTGGINDAGVIFEWDPSTKIYIKKIDLVDIDGAHPQRDLVYSNGKFYGSTYDGGSYNFGTFFQWDPVTNVYTKLVDFDGANGGHTYSNLIELGTKIYGVTSEGGAGAIFEWDVLTGEYNRRLEFDFYNTGLSPQSIVMDGGKLYGLNVFYGVDEGGASFDKGMIFEWDPSTGEFTKKIELDDISYGETGNLIKSGDKFYGTISGYLGGQNRGLLFEWDPVSNAYTKKFDFDGSNGANPMGMLTTKNGQLYGMTYAGGAYGWQFDMLGYGVIFQWDPSTNIYTKKIDFFGANGSSATQGLALYNGKFYGRTTGIEGGAIFEYDPINNRYTEKSTYGGGYSSNPAGNLMLFQNNFYGMSRGGGQRGYGGEIFGWDPATNANTGGIYFGWPSNDGYFPNGHLTLFNNKFYGSTERGGTDEEGLSTDEGVLFEWDPVTNVYNKKIDMHLPTGSYPRGTLTLFNNKLYGGTGSGGSNGKGVLFEWDQVTNNYTKKIDLNQITGVSPCELVAFNNKLYGVASGGGNNDAGVLFEWDPVTNVYTKKFDFDGANGAQPIGNLVVNNNKIYGITAWGGTYSAGVIFEWDPVTNIFTKKQDFNGSNGAHAENGLTLAPASVAKGLPGTCKTFPSITIDNSNNNQWVSIIDEDNNAVAEIKANGNNLGVVTVSMFINNAAVREDGTKKLYLDRNISIAPEVQPTTPVDIRLYIRATEYEALKNAVNSNGQSSGIDSINDISIYKVNGGCVPAVSTLGNPLAATAGTWETDYVFSASISSFSSFYFAGKAVCTAPVITQVCANPSFLWPPNHRMKDVIVNYKVNGDCQPVSTWLTVTSDEPVVGTGRGDRSPDWIIEDNHHLQLRAEREGYGNGRVYTIAIHATDAAGNTSTQKTNVLVPHHWSSHHGNDWKDEDGYIDANGDYVDHELNCRVIPNPSNNYFNLQIESGSSSTIELSLLDISGRLITKWNTVKDKTIRFGEQLKPGIYIVKVQQGEQQQMLKIIKQ